MRKSLEEIMKEIIEDLLKDAQEELTPEGMFRINHF